MIDTFALWSGLFGGLALFLYGMDKLSDALKQAAGERMRAILSRVTRNRVVAALTGAFVTSVIQSSSVTTVLVVGFISAGLMSLSQSVGIILGADVGTTITAQLVAFPVKEYGLVMIAVGFLAGFVSKKQTTRLWGTALLGLGLLFFGMKIMGDAMSPLRDYEPFLSVMQELNTLWLAILFGALFTALIQSSSASIAIFIVLASQGLLTLLGAIGLILGANLGTTVTALLASIGRPREAVRAAVLHLMVKVVGVAIWIPFTAELAELVVWVTPGAGPANGFDPATAVASARGIANAHTIFNVANTLLFLPIAGGFVWVVERLLPDRPEDADRVGPRYLDSSLLDTPSLALDRVRLELLHLGDGVKSMLVDILPAILGGTRDTLEDIRARDDEVDVLYGQIVYYLGEVSQAELTDQQTGELLKLMETAKSLENIGDVIETNLVEEGTQRINLGIRVSPATRDVLTEFHEAVVRAFDASMLAVTQKNPEAAGVVTGMKGEINMLADRALLHGAERLVVDEPRRLEAYTVETDVLENLKRIYYFCKRMARAAVSVHEEGDPEKSASP
jgi:phosphate:Na+ symporter